VLGIADKQQGLSRRAATDQRQAEQQNSRVSTRCDDDGDVAPMECAKSGMFMLWLMKRMFCP